MDTTCKTFCKLIGIVKSMIPWQSDPVNVSRDFWMPDQSCTVCYECDSPFTLFNRRHHCRICGRIFCAKCTENSVPVQLGDPRTTLEEQERVRVCNYCYKQWEQGLDTVDNGIETPNLGLSTSPSTTSLVSSKSSGTGNSSSITIGSMPYTSGPYQQVQRSLGLSPLQSPSVETNTDGRSKLGAGLGADLATDIGDPSSGRHGNSMNRGEDDDYECGVYQMDSETRHFSSVNDYHNHVESDEMSKYDGSHKRHPGGENIDIKSLSSSPLQHHNYELQGMEGVSHLEKKEDEHYIGDDGEASSSFIAADDVDSEPVDFENSGVLWLPPEPEDGEDENDTGLFDDDDDDGNATGEWGYLRSSGSFGSGEFRVRDRSSEEQKKAMKNVVDAHFRALIAQLLQAENVPVGEEDDKESWLEIITSLSWEAATLLKPDMSKGGGMDPGGYVKVKCIASGHRFESMVVKGVVFKKNVAHRRMTTKIKKPRLLIIGGALEYQRVSTHLSSFDTLLQQEMDHLKMAVAKIDAQHPDVVLVEKSVSRFAQEYLLAKDISLVLNIKKPLLDRIARCTGAQIVPSIDHLSSQKLGYCETFHVEKFLEDLGTAGQGGKKLVKTLMYFEGCPKPLGCTILLRGANGDELKKVKHVVQYGIFAAYHLALETSFLADEGASLPEFPLNSPITVALPDKSSSIVRSISTVPGFNVIADGKSEGHREPQRSYSVPTSDISSYISSVQSCLHNAPSSLPSNPTSSFSSSATFGSPTLTGKIVSDMYHKNLSPVYTYCEKNEMGFVEPQVAETTAVNNGRAVICNNLTANNSGSFYTSEQGMLLKSQNDQRAITGNQAVSSDRLASQQDGTKHSKELGPPNEESGALKEEFPPSPSDHQSILVSLSSRCVWKGTVCERSHLFRIKYYGSFDKPLGRYLRDHLFNQTYQCQSCEMPSEAHVHCYTHRQGTLTISVKKLPQITLQGEKEGKIWMWHRCLRCPRTDGFPPPTRRIVMSDAAWGLSFGKFLELSFSNHAAASRVASCGHSLHRDCLRFYGFGNMVACFRYASINVLSVHLPPAKLEFNYENQEWMQSEANMVVGQVGLLFSEVVNALRQIDEKAILDGGTRTPESRRRISQLEEMLQKEKAEFEESQESLLETLNREAEKGLPHIDILEINQLRRQLLFQSYTWVHRLIYAANLDNYSLKADWSIPISEHEGKPVTKSDNLVESDVVIKQGKGYSSCDSYLVDTKLDKSVDVGFGDDQVSMVHQETDTDPNLKNEKEVEAHISPSSKISDQSLSLETKDNVRRTLSDGQFPLMTNLSDTLDAAWTGEDHTEVGILNDNTYALPDLARENSSIKSAVSKGLHLDHTEYQDGPNVVHSVSSASSTKAPENLDDSVNWLKMPFLNLYRAFNKKFLASAQKLDALSENNPVYVPSFLKELRGEARLLLPLGVNDTVIPIYDDQATSIISYALASPQYHVQMVEEGERPKDTDTLTSLFSDSTFQPVYSSVDTASESYRIHGSGEESNLSMSGSRSSLVLDPVSYTKALHVRVSFGDDGPLGKVKYTVTCYYAKRFEALRRICCPSEIDYIRSLSRCKKWGAQGGKSNVFFAKTFDDRFIIKQVTKTELESFIQFAPAYFEYLSESIGTRSPTCLAKILGIYQVTSKHLRGKESKMDVLVIENLMYRRNMTKLYDLKGASRARYNSDSSGGNKVLLDQNLIEAMSTSPIFVGNKAKRLLERAVWNDTHFLSSVDVMDYSLLVGVDEEKHELVLGIIDFMRQYTWDKHLETWVKASGILGGSKNSSPTVISPNLYKKRFRKAMTTYFLMVPDQWSPPSIIPSKSQNDLTEENVQGGATVE